MTIEQHLANESNQPDDHSSSRATRSISGKLSVVMLLIALAVMFSLVSMLVFTTPLSRNELGLLGGLHITADDDNALWVGDRSLGHGKVDVSWNELLGATGHDPLAISIPSNATQQEIEHVISGDSAKVIWSQPGITGVFRGKQNADYAFHQMLVRRAEGLDHLFVIDCKFPDADADGRWQRIVIPIRARREGATDYFPDWGLTAGGNVSRGMIPSRRDYATFELKLEVRRGAAPTEFADELDIRPLWEPVAKVIE